MEASFPALSPKPTWHLTSNFKNMATNFYIYLFIFFYKLRNARCHCPFFYFILSFLQKNKKKERKKIWMKKKPLKNWVTGNCAICAWMRMSMCVWETKLVWLLLRGTLSSWTQTYFSISIKWPVTGLRGGKIHKTFSKSCQSISQSCRAGQQALLTPILCMQLTAACVSVVFVTTLGQRSALHFNHLPTTSELCHWTCRCGSHLMLIECFVVIHSQARFSFSCVQAADALYSMAVVLGQGSLSDGSA